MKLVFNAEKQWVLVDKEDLLLICAKCKRPLHPISDEHFYLCKENKICFHNECEHGMVSLEQCKPKSYTRDHIHLKIMGLVDD